MYFSPRALVNAACLLLALFVASSRAASVPKTYETCPPGSDTDFPDHELVSGLPDDAKDIEVCAQTITEKGQERRFAHGPAKYSVKRSGVQLSVTANYKAGKLDGAYVESGPFELKGKYEKGQRTGKWVLVETMDGALRTRAETTYKGGILHGPFRAYGFCWSHTAKKTVYQAITEGAFAAGSRDGRWTRWANIDDGSSNAPAIGGAMPCRKLEEVTYKRGLRNGKSIEHGLGIARDGSFVFFKKSEYSYRDDEMDGPFTTWQEGAPHLVAQKGNYVSGQPCGQHKRYFNGFDARTHVWKNVGMNVEDFGDCPKRRTTTANPVVEQDAFAPFLKHHLDPVGCGCQASDLACRMRCAAK